MREFRKLWFGQSVSAIGSKASVSSCRSAELLGLVYVLGSPLGSIRTPEDAEAVAR